jgi:hypothetical protein
MDNIEYELESMLLEMGDASRTGTHIIDIYDTTSNHDDIDIHDTTTTSKNDDTTSNHDDIDIHDTTTTSKNDDTTSNDDDPTINNIDTDNITVDNNTTDNESPNVAVAYTTEASNAITAPLQSIVEISYPPSCTTETHKVIVPDIHNQDNKIINNLHKLQSPVDPELLDNILIALQTYPNCQAKDDCFQFLRSNKIIPFSHILLIQYILNEGVILKQFDDPIEGSDTQNSNTQHDAILSSIVL